MFCPKCGEKFSDNLRYCPNCSTKVGEELAPNESFGETAEEIKKKKWNSFYFWPIISITLATVMGLVAFVGGRLLSGLCSVAAIVLSVCAILIRKGIIKSKSISFSVLLVMFSFLLIFQYIAFFRFDINTYHKYDWQEVAVSETLPKPPSKYGKIFYNTDTSFSMKVYHVSESEFTRYLAACDKKGFDFEDDKSAYSFVSYSYSGYEFTVSYEKSKNTMSVRLHEGEKFEPDPNSPSLDFMLDYIPQHFPS